MSRRNKGHATKDEIVRVLVTTEQKKKMQALANEAELSLSAWARTKLAEIIEAAS